MNSQNDLPEGQPYPVSVPFVAGMAAIGAELRDWAFKFGLFDSHGEQVSTAANRASGDIAFEAVTLDKSGVYAYSIRQLTPGGGGWATDSTEYPVSLHIIDNGCGGLEAELEYPNGEPVFVNYYDGGQYGGGQPGAERGLPQPETPMPQYQPDGRWGQSQPDDRWGQSQLDGRWGQSQPESNWYSERQYLPAAQWQAVRPDPVRQAHRWEPVKQMGGGCPPSYCEECRFVSQCRSHRMRLT